MKNKTLVALSTDYAATRTYYRVQIVSSLVSLVLYVVSTTYLSGAFESVAQIVVRFIPPVNPKWIELIIPTVISVFLGVVSSAIWDGLKSIYRRATEESRRRR